MTTPFQLKLRGIFLVGDSPENLTNTAGDIFSKAISAINNFFQHLINLFDQEFPPEERDEQIHRWTQGATPYLIGACVLITCLCCWCCLFSCISTIVVGIFNVVWSILRCLLQPFWSLFRCVFQPVWSVLRSICRCLCCCGRTSDERMMKAPGRSSMKISRAAFEGNPRGYFRDLRGQPNNFVY